MPRRANYAVIWSECAGDRLTIRDVGPWHEHPTVTNAAEAVVEELYRLGYLTTGKRLFYYDSLGWLDEIEHADGRFVGFRPGPGRGGDDDDQAEG